MRKTKRYLGIRGDMVDMFVFDGGCYFRWGYKGRPLEEWAFEKRIFVY